MKLAPDVTMPSATNSQLAALDIRLLLNFERSEIAMDKEAELVESRMRIAYSVPKHRRYMYSGYPSEPVLAEAAARCWAELSKANISIPGLLLTFMDNGYIGKGERGELVARLLLTLAFDAAVKQHTSADTRRSQSQQYTHSVPLRNFLEELFGVVHAGTILNSYPNVGMLRLGEAFPNAHVQFTHFIRAGDSSIMSTSGAYAAILRSSAIQCSSGQIAIDILIPVVLEPPSTPLEEAVMSGILISVKDRAEASSEAETDIDAAKLGFFPDTQEAYKDTGHGRPYIAVVLELGVQARASAKFATGTTGQDAKQASSSSKPKNSTGTAVQPPATPAKLIAKKTPDRRNPPREATNPSQMLKNPRYMIRVHGCSPTVYNVVTDKDQFALLLRSRSMISEHPRQSKESLDVVMRLKPFWSVAHDCYHWVSGTVDKRPAGDEVEGVYIVNEVAAGDSDVFA